MLATLSPVNKLNMRLIGQILVIYVTLLIYLPIYLEAVVSEMQEVYPALKWDLVTSMLIYYVDVGFYLHRGSQNYNPFCAQARLSTSTARVG